MTTASDAFSLSRHVKQKQWQVFLCLFIDDLNVQGLPPRVEAQRLFAPIAARLQDIIEQFYVQGISFC